MVVNKVRFGFSFIGNFITFLVQNEQRIKNLFLDYEIQTKVDTMPSGQEVKTLIFTKGNVRVQCAPNRVDYHIAANNIFLNEKEVFASAKEFYKLFGEIFYNLEAQRIAITAQSFIPNEDGKALTYLADKFGFNANFGNCNELYFKINTPVKDTNDLNFVMDLNMGEMKTKDTKTKVLLLSFDSNTSVNDMTPRFKPENFEKDFKPLMDLIEKRFKTFDSYK